jgi:hypothetical protein
MTPCALIIAASWPFRAFSNAASRAESGDRTLMYTFQGSSALVFIAILDLPAGPQGLVTWRGPTQKTRPCPVSQVQFNKMWSMLMASGAEKFAGGGIVFSEVRSCELLCVFRSIHAEGNDEEFCRSKQQNVAFPYCACFRPSCLR